MKSILLKKAAVLIFIVLLVQTQATAGAGGPNTALGSCKWCWWMTTVGLGFAGTFFAWKLYSLGKGVSSCVSKSDGSSSAQTCTKGLLSDIFLKLTDMFNGLYGVPKKVTPKSVQVQPKKTPKEEDKKTVDIELEKELKVFREKYEQRNPDALKELGGILEKRGYKPAEFQRSGDQLVKIILEFDQVRSRFESLSWWEVETKLPKILKKELEPEVCEYYKKSWKDLLFYYKIHLSPRGKEEKNSLNVSESKNPIVYQLDPKESAKLIADVTRLYITDKDFRSSISRFKVRAFPSMFSYRGMVIPFMVIYPVVKEGSALIALRKLDQLINFEPANKEYPVYPIPRFNIQFNAGKKNSGLFYSMADGDDKIGRPTLFDKQSVFFSKDVADVLGVTVESFKLKPA